MNTNSLILSSVSACLVAGWLASGVALAHGDIHERIESLSKQIAASPQNARLHAQRAELCRQHEDWQGALADCDLAKRLDPSLELDLLRSRTLLESGQAAMALPLLDGFLGRHPQHPQALACRARAETKLGQHLAAIADFREALKLTPIPEPDLVLECGDALVAQKCEKEAVQVLAVGIDKLGPIPSLVIRAMTLEIATKDFEAALTRVETMQQSAPRPEPWMAKRAAILALAGRIQDSRAAWQRLLEHLAALPNLERGSHAMSKLAAEAKQALTALDSQPSATGH